MARVRNLRAGLKPQPCRYATMKPAPMGITHLQGRQQHAHACTHSHQPPPASTGTKFDAWGMGLAARQIAQLTALVKACGSKHGGFWLLCSTERHTLLCSMRVPTSRLRQLLEANRRRCWHGRCPPNSSTHACCRQQYTYAVTSPHHSCLECCDSLPLLPEWNGSIANDQAGGTATTNMQLQHNTRAAARQSHPESVT